MYTNFDEKFIIVVLIVVLLEVKMLRSYFCYLSSDHSTYM